MRGKVRENKSVPFLLILECDMETSNEKNDKTWNDILLNVEVHGFNILKGTIIYASIIYIAIFPQKCSSIYYRIF